MLNDPCRLFWRIVLSWTCRSLPLVFWPAFPGRSWWRGVTLAQFAESLAFIRNNIWKAFGIGRTSLKLMGLRKPLYRLIWFLFVLWKIGWRVLSFCGLLPTSWMRRKWSRLSSFCHLGTSVFGRDNGWRAFLRLLHLFIFLLPKLFLEFVDSFCNICFSFLLDLLIFQMSWAGRVSGVEIRARSWRRLVGWTAHLFIKQRRPFEHKGLRLMLLINCTGRHSMIKFVITRNMTDLFDLDATSKHVLQLVFIEWTQTEINVVLW